MVVVFECSFKILLMNGFLTVPQAAKYARLTENTIRHHIKRGNLYAHQVPRTNMRHPAYAIHINDLIDCLKL